MSNPARSIHRITDLVAWKLKGSNVVVKPSFDVIPVDFVHRNNAFQAHIFLCRFDGEIDGVPYCFRKCYARGCPHNLCPHVSQAVMIANRYLQRDYILLRKAGIEVQERLFTLEDMLVKFDGYQEEHDPTLTIDDYVHMAKEGTEVSVEIGLEYVPAVETSRITRIHRRFLTLISWLRAWGKSTISNAVLPATRLTAKRKKRVARWKWPMPDFVSFMKNSMRLRSNTQRGFLSRVRVTADSLRENGSLCLSPMANPAERG